MDLQQRALRIGAAVILCAVLCRLLGEGYLQNAVSAAQVPEGLASFLLYLETGRVVLPQEETVPAETSPVETTVPAETQPEISVPTFTARDAALLEMTNYSGCQPNLEALLTTPLQWDLTGNAPTVLILHTHTTESYKKSPGENYEESGDYRTLDEKYNMLSVGARLAQTLEEGGLSVLHVTVTHDYPSYNGSYDTARQTIAQYLAKYPSIRLVLDLHRDAADDGFGGQMSTAADVNGQKSAQLMIVVGTDSAGLTHPNWQENLALAAKLQVTLEKMYPGLCRPLQLRSQRFNQDQSAGALLIEVGAAGNTHPEALTAAEALAQGILALANGTA